MAEIKTASQAKPKTGSKATRKSPRAAAEPADAIKLLKADHREVESYFKEYERVEEEAEKKTLAERICLTLTVHTQIEEEIF